MTTSYNTMYDRSPGIIPILYITELKNTPQGACTQLNKHYQVISSRFIPNLVIFQTITRCKFRNKPYVSKDIFRQILSHISWLFKKRTYIFRISDATFPKSICDKTTAKKCSSLSKISFQFWTQKQLFAIHFLLGSSDQQCSPHGDRSQSSLRITGLSDYWKIIHWEYVWLGKSPRRRNIRRHFQRIWRILGSGYQHWLLLFRERYGTPSARHPQTDLQQCDN